MSQGFLCLAANGARSVIYLGLLMTIPNLTFLRRVRAIEILAQWSFVADGVMFNPNGRETLTPVENESPSASTKHRECLHAAV